MITIQEIAKMAGVSTGTIDRVIHNRGRVSEKTRQKVSAIIKKSGYKPNVMARNLSLKRRFNVGVMMPLPHQDGNYWEMPAKGVEIAMAEMKLAQVNITFLLYDKYSESSFKRACDKVYAQEEMFDGLLIAPVLSKASEQFISRMNNLLPYVFIDSYIPQSSCLAYIGQQSYESGALAAKLMKLLVREPGTIAAFRVLPEDYHIDDRVKGFLEVMAKNPIYHLKTYEVDRQHNVNIYFDTTEKIIAENDDLRGIFVPSSCTHQAAKSLMKLGSDKEIHLIGYDLVAENMDYLQSGLIDFLINQRPVLQGYEALYTLYKHIVLQEPVDSKKVMPIDIVTKENLESYQGYTTI